MCFGEDLFFPIYPLIKPLTDIHHPDGEHLEGLVDEGIFLKGVGHRTGDGG